MSVLLDPRDDQVDVIQAESKRLNEYLNTLSIDTLTRPSAVDGWDIGDVVAHLVFGSSGFRGFVTRGLQGDTSTPKVLWDPGATAASAAARIDELSTARRAELGDDQLIPTFKQTSGLVCELLDGLGPSELATTCYHLVLGVTPIRETLKWWITELGMHSLDIRSVLEDDAHLSPEVLPAFMDFMPDVVRWSFQGTSALPAHVRFRWEVDPRQGQPPTRNDIVVHGDSAAMEPSGPAPADVTFHCDAETFALLMYGRGRLGFDSALASGRLSMEGDRELVLRFARWFPGA